MNGVFLNDADVRAAYLYAEWLRLLVLVLSSEHLFRLLESPGLLARVQAPLVEFVLVRGEDQKVYLEFSYRSY